MTKVKAKILYLPNYDKENWGPMNYAHDTDTGFDIRACNTENITLLPHERVIVPAGFKIMPEEGYALQIRARSGNAFRLGLTMGNGVGTIDNGYLGEIGVLIVNTSNTPFTIERGMKIAQGVVEPIYQFEFTEIENEEELGPSLRGNGGFGSTGTK